MEWLVGLYNNEPRWQMAYPYVSVLAVLALLPIEHK